MSVDLADARARSLRERSRLVLHCGNIASWSKLKKRAVLTSTEEVSLKLAVYAKLVTDSCTSWSPEQLVSTVENTLTSHLGSKQPRDEGNVRWLIA